MKKKSFAVFLMLLMLFAAAGSIYHEGIKSHVSASQVDHPKREFAKKEVESTFAFQHQTMVMDEVTEESPNVNIATPQPNNDNSNRDIVQNTTLPSSKDVHIESEVPADNQEATDPANPEDESLEEKQSDDFIIIDEQKYYNNMHEEKFSH